MAAFSSVLIVDDNVEARVMLGQLLAALGTPRVCEASSAEEALEILTRESFALIVSDYCLGGMDGVQFLERIREAGDPTPVLLLSGAPEQQDILRATKLPKVDVFPKPFRLADLTSAMERLLAA